MFINRLFHLLMVMAILVLTACGAPIPTSAPATATDEPTAVTALPFAHTACAEGVDLTGQTVSFYHILDPNDQVETVYDPLRAGYADAAEYFNTHGGICGGTLQQVFDDTHWGSDQTIYDLFSALNPKPTVVTLYGSGVAVQLADQLAQDQIPALNIRGGSTASAYGEDGQTLGWIFAANPLYVDQVGAMCNFIVANPDRFPQPILGFLNFADAWAQSASEGSLQYCQSLGIGYAGTSTFSGDATNIQPVIQKLVEAGANIIYTNSHENGPALVARNLFKMGLQDKVTLATVNRAMDPYVAFSGEADLGEDGLPVISGMLGSLPVRTWAETDNPGIQLITEQADLYQRPLTMHTDGYIMGWDTTDLLIEVYIQTGNRVGFENISGADVKETLENIVYAPLSGVEQIDYQGGARRALAEDRIGEMNFLGQDGKTPAGAGNPPMVIKVGDEQHLVPMIVPLTDFQTAPDLRPGGADVPAAISVAPTTTQVTLGMFEGTIAFRSNRTGNNEIYVMSGDGSGLINLTNDPSDDDLPAWSPDGTQVVFCTRRDGNYEIYLMNADGSDKTNLSDSPLEDCSSSWSPDGTKVAFASNRDGNNEIYVMNADGSGKTRLIDNPAFDMFPNWAPDGKRIVFVSDRDGQMDIYVMNVDGGGVIRLSDMGVGDAFPTWSPDGTKIAFGSNSDGNYDIYVMNSDGSGLTRLTDNPANDWFPSWSPDGTQITFSSERDGNAEIYAMNADGSDQMRLTNNPADDEISIWQP